jgi:hypothetical protein
MTATFQPALFANPGVKPQGKPLTKPQGITRGLNPGLQPAQNAPPADPRPTPRRCKNPACRSRNGSRPRIHQIDGIWVCWHCGEHC